MTRPPEAEGQSEYGPYDHLWFSELPRRPRTPPLSDPLTAPRNELTVMLDSLIDRAKDVEYSPHDDDYLTKLAAARSAIESLFTRLQQENKRLSLIVDAWGEFDLQKA